MPDHKTAIIIGAGPAGLTAAIELLDHTDILPVILEAGSQVGGLSRTIDHHGNKIDIGGHRFFSKSQRVIDWWQRFLPLERGHADAPVRINYRNQQAAVDYASAGNVEAARANGQPGDTEEQVMMVRPRKSRIYYQRQLFDYPLSLNPGTLRKLGIAKAARIFASYLRSKLLPIKHAETLEQFFINRFGRELYLTFFKDYTEKVWGVPCNQLPASWGQQRIKNLDVGKLILHGIRSMFTSNTSLDQKGTSTSLIEQFLYPKYGPGQMWETVAAEISQRGGVIRLNTEVTGITGDGAQTIRSVTVRHQSGTMEDLQGDYFFSTMPVKQLVQWSRNLPVPSTVREVAEHLEYRDFLIVGILVKELQLREKDQRPVTDNWIYIQDKNLHAGRLQFFHNWSPFMVADAGTGWVGVEYFCREGDALWSLPDQEMSALAVREMESIGILQSGSVLDTLVVRVHKAYPSYFGSYEQFPVVRDYLDSISNLFPIGRNGMHRYNNSDHSMLTAMAAVENIVTGRRDKSNLWEINTEEEYHEEQTGDGSSS